MNKKVEQVLRARPGFSSTKDLAHKIYGLSFIHFHVCSFNVFLFISFQFYLYIMVISMNQLPRNDSIVEISTMCTVHDLLLLRNAGHILHALS